VHTTWRATLAQGLLAAGLLLAIGMASALTFGVQSRAIPLLGWLLVSILIASAVVASVHQHRTDRLRRSLAIGLTHHLRTSLSHIQTFNEMLLMGREASAEQRTEWLEIVGREAQRLGFSVENLLFLMQDHRSREFPIRRAVDLGSLLEDVACEHAPAADRKVQLEVVPPAGIMVEADAAALRHALGNLIDGAARTAREGSTISASAGSNGAVARVEVLFDPADGDGRRDTRWHILDDAQLEGGTDEGFGLELAVVRHVVRLHGGRASHFHRPGRSCFTVELPLAGA
jgi:signal transduction histidine kinase